MPHQSTEDTHIFTLVLGHRRLNFSEELSTEDNLIFPSSLVDDKGADAVLVSILDSDDIKQTSFAEDEGPADLLDEIFLGSDNSEKLVILMHCYKVLGLFAKVFDFSGPNQGDFIRVLSAAPDEQKATEQAQFIRDECFGDDDDELEEQLAETATVPAAEASKMVAPPNLKQLADSFPELNMSNYDAEDVDNLHNWALEVVQAITAMASAQREQNECSPHRRSQSS